MVALNASFFKKMFLKLSVFDFYVVYFHVINGPLCVIYFIYQLLHLSSLSPDDFKCPVKEEVTVTSGEWEVLANHGAKVKHLHINQSINQYGFVITV